MAAQTKERIDWQQPIISASLCRIDPRLRSLSLLWLAVLQVMEHALTLPWIQMAHTSPEPLQMSPVTWGRCKRGQKAVWGKHMRACTHTHTRAETNAPITLKNQRRYVTSYEINNVVWEVCVSSFWRTRLLHYVCPAGKYSQEVKRVKPLDCTTRLQYLPGLSNRERHCHRASQYISKVKQSAHLRSHIGWTIEQQGRKQGSLHAKLGFRASPPSVVRWDDRGECCLVALRWLWQPVTGRSLPHACLSTTLTADPSNMARPAGHAIPVLLSDVSDSWQDTWDAAGRGQSTATCTDIRIYCCQGDERKGGWKERRVSTHTLTRF